MRILRTGVLCGLLAACGAPEPDEDAASGTPAAQPDRTAEAGAAGWTMPRTAWGDPDLRGVWPIDHLNGTPVQRPEEFGERVALTDEEFAERVDRLSGLNARYDEEDARDAIGQGHWSEMGEPNRLTSLVVDPANGRLPALTAAGEAKSATMTSTWSDIEFDDIGDFNALDRCITRGMPASMFPFMYNSGIQIVQAPGVVAIRLEIIHETRIVKLDGRAAPPAGVLQWMGDSRGYWDGDTLVIETTNFNGGSPMLIVGPGAKPIPTSAAMRIVERLTRTGPDAIDYEITVEDPEMLAAPWTARLPWRRDGQYGIYEYACHEGNTIVREMMNITAHERRMAAGQEAAQ